MGEEKKDLLAKAPYASVNKFSDAFAKIRNLQLKSINTAVFNKWGYSSFDSSSIISTLKFLGIIDDLGGVTDKYNKIKSEITYKQELIKIIKEAYGGLFNLLGEEAHLKNKKDIEDNLILEEAYPGTAKKTASKATNIFVWLCEEAGLREKKSDKPLNNSSHRVIDKKTKKTSNKVVGSPDKVNMPNGIIFNINITKDTTEEDVIKSVNIVGKALKRIQNDKE